MNKKKILSVCFCLSGVYANSQSLERSVTATSGNYFYQAGTGSLSFTVGENAVTTLTAPNIILTQGFQHPDTSEITIVEEINAAFSVEIFPNPVSEFLTFRSKASSSLLFSFYDEAGRLISVPQQKYDLQIVFNVSKLAAGFYTLSVAETEKKTVATKKFVKQ